MGKKVFIGDLRLGAEEKALLNKVIESGKISEGRMVQDFERLFAAYAQNRYCVALNSGTSAMIAGLYALLYDERYPRVKKGAKVITTALTYAATANAIVLAGMEPVFIDIAPDSLCIDCGGIEELLENAEPEEYCMLLPVHLMGYPCDMDRINGIARKYGLLVFEDCAQAHGSVYKGSKVGTLSLLSDFSFYIAHNIQAGEMGAVVTNDEAISRSIRRIKANGRKCDCAVCTRMSGGCRYQEQEDGMENDPRFTHEYVGFNFKTMEFPAAIGVAQMRHADAILHKRQENVRRLNGMLAKYGDRLILPPYSPDCSYMAYPLIIRREAEFLRKDLRAFLQEKGIESRPLFGSIPTRQPAYAHLAESYRGKLSNAEYAGDCGLYIGCHQYLDEDDIEYVGEVFRQFMED